MRILFPALIASSVVIALAGATTQAQISSPARGTAPSATATTTTSSSTPGTISPSGTAGSTSGPSISGTSSGDAFSGPSRGNAPPVGAAASGSTIPNAGSSVPAGTNPLLAPGVAVNANGERMFVNPETGVVVTDTGTGTASAITNNASATGTSSISSSAATTPELDRATRREAQHARETVESKGQMMQSIAPRTKVDRTDQMPDDATPLLSPSRR